MEVLLATLLFILLSPGLVITLPPGKGGMFEGETTSNLAVLVHAVIFFTINKLTAPDSNGKVMWPFGYLNQAANEIGDIANRNVYTVPPLVATLFFILLSPGLLFQIPPLENGFFMSQTTDTISILVHGLIYFIVLKMYSSSISACNSDGSVKTNTDGSPMMLPGKTDATSGIVPFLNCQINSV